VREIRTLRAMWRGLEYRSRFGFQGTYLPLLLNQQVTRQAGWGQVRSPAVWLVA
jgi:hypothetical protein